jgi:hypothetical protein
MKQLAKIYTTQWITFLLALIFSFAITLPAHAAFCRTLNTHKICILSIKRSAKNHWEYRAIVSIDGVEQPLEIYNCRDRVQIRPDGSVVRFDTETAGDLICNVLKR